MQNIPQALEKLTLHSNTAEYSFGSREALIVDLSVDGLAAS